MKQITNFHLLSHLQRLNQEHHRLEAELLLYLGELDRRQGYREQACSSAFEFCVSRMGFSEDVAFKRVGAARLMRQFPCIYDLLADGRIHLTALMLLKPHLTEANHEEWLSLACNQSKRQVEKLVAARCPQPDVPARIRRLPDPKSTGVETRATPAEGSAGPAKMNAALAEASAAAPLATTASMALAPQPVAAVAAATAPADVQAPRVAPLSSSTYRVTFTANEQLKQKLDRARDLLSHCIAPSDLPALIERALDQLLEREERRRYGAPPKRDCSAAPCQSAPPERVNPRDPDPPTPSGGSSNSAPCRHFGKSVKRQRKHFPAKVRGAVFERDGGQCAYVDERGQRCQERHFLQFHHVEAHAIGGAETVENLQIRCAMHNAMEADNLFGRGRVQSAIRHARQNLER